MLKWLIIKKRKSKPVHVNIYAYNFKCAKSMICLCLVKRKPSLF